VAIKAGVRSELATLWFIDDQATAQLVAEFYAQLRDPLISKAVALQRAQVKTLSDPDHQHPSYWAPFLLINNWLLCHIALALFMRRVLSQQEAEHAQVYKDSIHCQRSAFSRNIGRNYGYNV
jgi:hypothetical protein